MATILTGIGISIATVLPLGAMFALIEMRLH